MLLGWRRISPHRLGPLNEGANLLRRGGCVLSLPIAKAVESLKAEAWVLDDEQKARGTQACCPLPASLGLLVKGLHGGLDLEVDLRLTSGHDVLPQG